jgi:hypothetical protein
MKGGQVRLSHTGYMGHFGPNDKKCPYMGVCTKAIFRLITLNVAQYGAN